jgi:hypothetical protein
MKYAGANWLKESKKKELSPFGDRVADVLGQVEKGLYHMEGCLNYLHSDWQSNCKIEVPLRSNLATFDAPNLTLLVFCCIKAEMMVEISGFSASAVRLKFLNVKSTEPLRDLLQTDLRSKDLADEFSFRDVECFDCVSSRVEKSVGWFELVALVVLCHHNCIRGSIIPKSNQSISLWLHQRNTRVGLISERHPTLASAIVSLKDYYSPTLPLITLPGSQ